MCRTPLVPSCYYVHHVIMFIMLLCSTTTVLRRPYFTVCNTGVGVYAAPTNTRPREKVLSICAESAATSPTIYGGPSKSNRQQAADQTPSCRRCAPDVGGPLSSLTLFSSLLPIGMRYHPNDMAPGWHAISRCTEYTTPPNTTSQGCDMHPVCKLRYTSK